MPLFDAGKHIPEGTPLQVPCRDHNLPDFYRVKSHPLISPFLQETRRVRLILVYLFDSRDVEAAQKFSRYAEEKLEIPEGSNADMVRYGLTEFEEGTVIFARDVARTSLGYQESDILQAYVATSVDVTETFQAEVIKIRDEMLGPRESRTPHMVWFEDGPRAIKVQGSRAYSNGCTVQPQRQYLVAPAAGNKVIPDEERDDNLRLRENLLKTLIPKAVSIFKILAPDLYQNLDIAAELHNTPRIGCDENCLFTGAQQNLATAVGPKTGIGLHSHLQAFGGKHLDKQDSNGGYTGLTCGHDLPPGYEGGRFHLVELGGYVRLDGIKMVFFSGLRMHGGTPPLAPNDSAIPDWAYRWTSVLYPQSIVLNGQGAVNVASKPDLSPLQLTPEMRDDYPENHDPSFIIEANHDPAIQYPELHKPVRCREATFASDGDVMMSPQAIINFTSRSSFQLMVHTMRQLGGNVTLNYEVFRQSQMFEKNGYIYQPQPWPLAPDGQSWTNAESPQSLSPRQEAISLWRRHCARLASAIPSEVVKMNKEVEIATGLDPGANRDPGANNGANRNAKLVKKIAGPTSTSIKKSVNRSKRGKGSRGKDGFVEFVKASTKLLSVPLHTVTPSRRRIQSRGQRASHGAYRRKATQKRSVTSVHKNDASKQSRDATDALGAEDDVMDVDMAAEGGSNENNFADPESDDGTEDDKDDDVYDVAGIIAHKTVKRGNVSELQYFIRWAGYDTYSWVSEQNMNDGPMLREYKSKTATRFQESIWSPRLDGNSKVSNLIDSLESRPAKGDTFLERLQGPAIAYAISTFQRAALACNQHPNLKAWPEIVSEITKMHGRIRRDPLSVAAASAVASSSSLLDQMCVTLHRTDATIAIQRQTMMLTHWHLDRWLKTCLDEAMKTISLSWIHTLCRKISSVIESKLPFDFNSSTFLPDISPNRCYTYAPPSKGLGSKLTEHKLSIARQIISIWLGLPFIYADDARSKFLEIVMDSPGKYQEALLLVKEVWETYDNPRRLYKSRAGDKVLGQFSLEAKDHPVIGKSPSPEASELLRLLYEAHIRFLYADGSVIPTDGSHNGPSYTPFSNPGTTTLPSSSAPQTDQSILIDTHVSAFKDWLIDMYDAATLSLSTVNMQQQRMVRNMDGWCPFREMGTSRKVALRPNGPFEPHRISTREGIFSALVFRGILFGSQVMKDFNRSCYFRNLEDWSEWRASLAHVPDSDICHPCPYGPSRGRVIKNIADFWESSQILHEFLGDRPDCRMFSDVVDWVASHRLPDQRMAFPSFGTLGSYLLAVDLVYSGRLQSPTLDELALMVQSLDRGAANALRKMHPVSGQFNVADAYKQFHHKVVQALPTYKDRMGYDIFTTEHALCKYSKGKSITRL
ncbi:hypothetical protein VKT23_008734 [Stygiomarasmius scandens]|uniref:Chromo domain-containing protein n=1 Tax=Marasmiellus scandens TaxID=2682957 RepID=A0ABR1JGI0_9AGAR